MRDLAFPYTWSNAHASEQALLANALIRPRFSDLVLLMQHYGEHTLFATMELLESSGELPKPAADELRSMLNNIARGLHEFQRKHPPQSH
ncbi:MAG: hypothetical protein ACQETD_10705 [Pseudomonadota bacterium]